MKNVMYAVVILATSFVYGATSSAGGFDEDIYVSEQSVDVNVSHSLMADLLELSRVLNERGSLEMSDLEGKPELNEFIQNFIESPHCEMLGDAVFYFLDNTFNDYSSADALAISNFVELMCEIASILF